MNELKIVTEEQTFLYTVPEAFDEMTREQFICTAHKLLCSTNNVEDKNYYLLITGISDSLWKKLHFFEKYSIRRLFDFTDTLEIPMKMILLRQSKLPPYG